MNLDFGDVPGWIEAIATSLAFAGTTTLLWIESGRRKVERTESRRSQAALVAHWLDKDDDDSWRLLFRNSSNVPVYNVRFHLYRGEVAIGSVAMARIEPSEARTRGKVDRWLNEGLEDFGESEPIRIDFLFTDAEGRNWARDLNGLLVFLEQRELGAGEEWLQRYSVKAGRWREK